MVGKVACMILLCMVVVAPPRADAITCGQISSGLLPCLGYLKGGGAVPPRCCSGVIFIARGAQTTPDRQAACKCLKSLASSAGGVNSGYAASLPGKCGVRIPYKISASTDCSKVK